MKRKTKLALFAGAVALCAAVAWFGWLRDDPERLLKKYRPAMEWIRQHHRFPESRGAWVTLPANYAHLSGDGRVDAEIKNDKLLVAFAVSRYKGANMWGYVISDRPLQGSDFTVGFYTEVLCLSIDSNEYVVDQKLSDRCVKVHFSLD